MSGEAAPAFQRSIKVTGLLFLTLSSITPASSVFVIVPGLFDQAGTGGLLAMAAAALVALAMAFVYAELGSAFPTAGGEYSMLGGALSPFVGAVFMVMNVVGSTLSPAALALGAADYLQAFWPGAAPAPTAVAMMVGTTLLGLLNIRLNAWITGAFLAVELAALCVVAWLGFAHPARPLASVVLHPVLGGAHAGAAPSLVMIGLASAVGCYAYNGFGAAVYFSEETHEAPRRVARAIILSLLLTIAFEMIPVAALLVGAPDTTALLASTHPFFDFIQVRGGTALADVISACVALAIANAVLTIMLINARFLFASARDRAWHPRLNGALSRVHPRFGSPWAATLLAGVLASAACFIPLGFLLVLNGAGVVVLYVLLCLAALAGRWTGRTRHGLYRMPLFPLAPAFALVALAYLVYANWLDPTTGRPSLIASAATVAASGLYVLWSRRRRGVAGRPAVE
jgi:amino acid transporter